jgi:2-phospho-L-lactate/phosphoenolpyruvate guanylyltransferase
MFILVPCKELNAGKSRLSSCLDAQARRGLCELFLIKTLELAAGLVPRNRIRLVAADEDAGAIAGRHGIATIADAGDGLNAALDHARTHLTTQGNLVALMVLPVDLPFATADSIAKATGTPGDVLIAPDEKDTGTNLLFLGPKALQIPFSFGDNSFIRHCEAARAAALDLAVVRDWRIACDIDEPAQFAAWAGSQAANADCSFKLDRATG